MAKSESKREVKKNFFYPEHNVTIIAKDREEADNKLKESLSSKAEKEQS